MSQSYLSPSQFPLLLSEVSKLPKLQPFKSICQISWKLCKYFYCSLFLWQMIFQVDKYILSKPCFIAFWSINVKCKISSSTKYSKEGKGP